MAMQYRHALLGWPIDGSLSPLLHNSWFQGLSLPGHYTRRAVPPEADFEKQVSDLIGEGFTGFNVTIPYKEQAFDLSDEVSDAAKLLGVVNTLNVQDGRISGENTDWWGFAQSLRQANISPAGKTVLILGAGGAAPAVAYGLSTLEAGEVFVSNRTMARAAVLADRFDFITGTYPWDHIGAAPASFDLIVNTTSLGMGGTSSPVLDFSQARSPGAAVDIVYYPAATGLLTSADAHGWQTLNGTGMLVWQAARSFEIWTGQMPPGGEATYGLVQDRLARREAGPVQIALTGSIGAGKSTVLRFFEEAGCATWDADAAVHRLYDRGGAAVAPIAAVFGEVVIDGAISRERLSARLADNPELFAQLEAIVHPLVTADRAAAVDQARRAGAGAIVCDIPLLFETGGGHEFDHVVTVHAHEAGRRARVLSRPGMTPEKFANIDTRQVPQGEKRRRAHFVIPTDCAPEETRCHVQALVARLLKTT